MEGKTRIIKFRALQDGRWHYFTVGGLSAAAEGEYYWLDNPDTPVCEYIGLKDTNGVDIYEGDVLRATWFELDPEDKSGSWEIEAPVEFVGAGFKVLPKLSWYGGWLDLVLLENIEVIGNIYENPELLSGK